MGWLLETKAVSRAREKFNEMQMQMALADDGVQSQGRPVASTSTTPEDTDQNDLATYLAVIARFAEAKLLMKGSGTGWWFRGLAHAESCLSSE
jgi:hypothetical protein